MTDLQQQTLFSLCGKLTIDTAVIFIFV